MIEHLKGDFKMLNFKNNTDRLPSVWEDLVMDFLEMACFLSPDQQTYLIEALEEEGTETDNVHVYPSFCIEGRVVIICEEKPVRECWLYYPKEKKLVKR